MRTATGAISVGDIFASNGDFYQVVKTTAETVTVRPIESRFVGYADEQRRERAYIPVRDRFTLSPFFTDAQNERGKRCVPKNWSAREFRPQIDVGCYWPAHLWDGEPSICDTYN